jgi:hypothetical protein
MAVAAPELFDYRGRLHMACLMPDLKGLRTAPLEFV